MTYYLSKVFWRFAAPTSALVLISESATLWAVLDNSKFAVWLAAAAACALIIAAFTPIGLALTVPLEFRFAPSDSQVPPDGIVLLGGSGLNGVAAGAALSQDYSKARLIFSGFRNDPASFKIFSQLGGDPARIICIERARGCGYESGTRRRARQAYSSLGLSQWLDRRQKEMPAKHADKPHHLCARKLTVDSRQQLAYIVDL